MSKYVKKLAKRKEISGDLENAIIKVWSCYGTQLRASRRNAHILIKMCQDLREEGHDVSISFLQIKLNNLRRKYYVESSKVRANEGAQSGWENFSRVHEIMESKRMTNVVTKKEKRTFPIFVMESGLEEAIIDIWNDYEEQLRDKSCNNNEVFTKMTEALKIQGFDVTIARLKSNIHSLRTTYAQEKQRTESRGGTPSDWPYYSRVNEIIENNRPKNIVQDSFSMPVDNFELSCSSNDQVRADSPTSSRKTINKDNLILNELNKMRMEFKQQEEEDIRRLIAMEEKFLEVETKKANALANISAAFRVITDKFFDKN